MFKSWEQGCLVLWIETIPLQTLLGNTDFNLLEGRVKKNSPKNHLDIKIRDIYGFVVYTGTCVREPMGPVQETKTGRTSPDVPTTAEF
uniref:Transposase_23 domain-containing protein n=1 Tax=Bursaphelenchus xylophilus TaxID=6326 RepID=A0A1I7RKL4_BURXY